MSFPHTRGDGPYIGNDSTEADAFSPHPWGWTVVLFNGPQSVSVFPTPVGMDRDDGDCSGSENSFPHTRGDGPHPDTLIVTNTEFSPHPWGWTGVSHPTA